MKYFKLWLIAVFLIGIIRILEGCSRYTPIVTMSIDRHYLAVTICDQKDNAVIVENEDYTKERKYTLIHEFEHVAQIKRVGGCDKFQESYSEDSLFRFHSEAEAECSSFDAMEKDGLNPQMKDLVFFMKNHTGSFLSVKQIAEELPCNSRRNNAYPIYKDGTTVLRERPP